MTSLTPSLETPQVSTRARPAEYAVLVDRFAPWATALLVVATLGMVHRDFPVGVAQDDGLYVILAKAIATGQGFRFINLPGTPAGVHYPPGYPLFLAALWRFASTLDARLHLFAFANVALLGVASAATFMLARRLRLSTRAAGVCTVAGFLMPPAMWMGTALLSEPLWLALSIPWLLRAESAAKDVRATHARTWLALGLTAGIVALVRTQSVTLLVGLLAVLLVRGQWKAAVITVAGAVVMLLPWQIWVAHQGQLPPELAAKYGAYAPWLVEGFHAEGIRLVTVTLRRNIVTMGGILGSMSGPPGASWVGLILLAAPVIAGARRLAKRAPVTLVMIVAHLAIILAWPFEPRRFVWTSWPFVVLWVAAGIVELHEHVSQADHGSRTVAPAQRFVRLALRADTILIIAFAALTTGIIAWSGAYRVIAEGQARRIVATVSWVNRHAASGAVIATEDETAVFLYTGHRALPTTSFTAASYARYEGLSASVLDRVFADYHPDLAIVSWKTSVDAADRLASGPRPLLRAVDFADKSVVFQRIR